MRTLRRVVPLVVGLALVASSSGCEWPAGTRFVHPVFDEFAITSDVVYRSTTDYQGNPIDLKLDIYQPVGDTRSERPVVMWMFGGGWFAGDKGQMAPYAEDVAKRGYVGVSIQYRLRAQADVGVEAILDAWQDAQAAVQWLKDHAVDYRLDTDAIVAAGYSAGAVNTLHLLFLSDPSPVAGGVAIAGFTPVAATAGDPPLVMHQGTNDTTVNPANAESTCNQTKSVGNHCTFFTYPTDHLIAFQEEFASVVRDRTATWIFETVLWPRGYREEHLPAAA
jgi:acetyl esterase/lipase